MTKKEYPNLIAGTILELRDKRDETQEEFGLRYGVSGPAVFKFEKGYVNPSLALWRRIAADAGLDEARAIRLWVRERLPQVFRHHIDIAPSPIAAKKHKKHAAIATLLADEEFAVAFKPSPRETDLVAAWLAPFPKAGVETARMAFLLVRLACREV